MNGGFFKIQRKFFSHPLWTEKRVYSRAEAFLDLLQLAAFVPTKRLCAGVMIELQPGQLVGSERYLSERWGWSTKKVRAYFQMVVSEKMAVIEKKREGSIITLCNYQRYANSDSYEEAPKKQQRSAEEAPRKRIEEREELKKENTPLPPKGDYPGFELEASMMPAGVSRLSATRKTQIKVKGNTPLMSRIGAFLNRRADTIWTIAELESLLAVCPSQEEIDGVEFYYTDPNPRDRDNRRTGLVAVLNNWKATEVDRARSYILSQQ